MQQANLDGALGGRDFGGSNPSDQTSTHKHYFAFHKSTPLIPRLGNDGLHLDLEADSSLIEVRSHCVESSVPVERHHARVELLDNVVEVHFRGSLLVAWSFSMGKFRLGKLAEDFELADADLFRKEVASKHIAALALGIRPVIAAQPVVIGI